MDNYEIENEIPVESSDHLTIEYQTPPVKDQLVQATIGIGAALAPVLLYVVGAAIYSGVGALRTRRKAKKLAALAPEPEATTEEPTLEEE